MSENQTLEQLIQTRYPFPISHAYAYMAGRLDEDERYDAGIACFEVTLKYIASVVLANWVRDIQTDQGAESSYLCKDLFDRLSRPVSLGHWHDVLRLVLRWYHERRDLVVIPELFDFYYRITEEGKPKARGETVQLIQSFIKERNEDAHHRNRAQVTVFQQEARQKNLEQDLLTLLGHLKFLADHKLFYVGHAEHKGGKWLYQANSACGAEYPFRQYMWQTVQGVDSRRCLIADTSGSAILDLYPFVIITSEGRLPHDDLFFFDGLFSSGRANFMSYHAGVYIDEPADEGSPAALASDGISGLLSFLQRQAPSTVEPETTEAVEEPSAVEIYGLAVQWAWEKGQRQSISLDGLRQILKLTREEALQQEQALETKHGIEVAPETEVPFEGEPSWANLAYYILDTSGQSEMSYRNIAVEAAQLKNDHDPNWQLGDSANVETTINSVLSRDPHFYRVRRGYYRLTKHNELLSNPSWANLAYFVLQYHDSKRQGMHLHEIAKHTVELKEKYSDWRRENTRSPANTISATMSMDRRFESLPERGYWRLAERGQERTETKAVPTQRQAMARDEVYEGVLTRLSQIGTLEPLPFGRTYYTLDGNTHLMFRFSREHHRSGEHEYFLGVTPQYFERIRRMGHGFMVFVLGSADNVLIVPAETFARWVEGIEPSGSGIWPLGFYQSDEKDRTERWVPGAGREDVSTFLNDYDRVRQPTVQRPEVGKRRRQASAIRMPDLFRVGLIQPGDQVYTLKCPDKPATVIDARMVEYQGSLMTYGDWGTQVTGWTAINIYPQVVLARTGQTLQTLRIALQGTLGQGSPEPPSCRHRGHEKST